jgi:hypothetical protein
MLLLELQMLVCRNHWLKVRFLARSSMGEMGSREQRTLLVNVSGTGEKSLELAGTVPLRT